ncbi:XK-related protein 8 [Rhinophrynus dorsalis]
MPNCMLPRYRLLDLLFALGGTVTFLLDLCSDVWGAVEYYRAGDVAWAALLLCFYGLSSAVLQLHSWGWFWADRRNQDETWDLPSEEAQCTKGEMSGNNEDSELKAKAYTNSVLGMTAISGVVESYDWKDGYQLFHTGMAPREFSTFSNTDIGDGQGCSTSVLDGKESVNGHIEHGTDRNRDDDTGFSKEIIPVQVGAESVAFGSVSTEDVSGSGYMTHEKAGPDVTPMKTSTQCGQDVVPVTLASLCVAVVLRARCQKNKTSQVGTGAVMTGVAGKQYPMDLKQYGTVRKEAGQEDKSPDAGMKHALDVQTNHLLKQFYTSRILLCPSCLVMLHVLQLGYPLRCIHSLEVGVSAYRSSEQSPSYEKYQEYAHFLTHDISMMRLMETFLENTPQLILLLYIVLRRSTIYTFQYYSISISFLSISWAILDYHQSLRMFLKEKQKLNLFSSVIYFLWNFLLISSRIVCITLFTVVYHWWIALHFSLLWIAFFTWTTLQKTDFMQSKILEHFYRGTVAVILYFSWFNISDGRTIYRCLFYYVFIMIDCVVLFMSWKFLRIPSILDDYEKCFALIVGITFFIGLLFRLFYYKYFHPNIKKESKYRYDEVDGVKGDLSGYRLMKIRPEALKNPRMLQLSQRF